MTMPLQERLPIYKKHFPNFNEIINQENRGKGKKGILLQEIADIAGFTIHTVKHDFAQLRKEKIESKRRQRKRRLLKKLLEKQRKNIESVKDYMHSVSLMAREKKLDLLKLKSKEKPFDFFRGYYRSVQDFIPRVTLAEDPFQHIPSKVKKIIEKNQSLSALVETLLLAVEIADTLQTEVETKFLQDLAIITKNAFKEIAEDRKYKRLKQKQKLDAFLSRHRRGES
jgi:hypothetical protein